MNLMLRHRRIWFSLGGVLLALAATAGLLLAYWHLDKTHVFYQVAGEYGGYRELEVWDTAESHCSHLEIWNHRGDPVVNLFLREPQQPAVDSRIIITYAGARTGKKILDLLPERPDLILAAVQYPYEAPERWTEYLRWPFTVRRAAFQTVAGGMLTVSLLEQARGLDLSRLTVVGVSLGSAFATLHSALDTRVPRVLIIHGGGNYPLVFRAIARARDSGPWIEPLLWIAARIVDTFDPIHHAGRISPRELVLIAARDDEYFPPESVLALYEAAQEPKGLIWTETVHVRSKRRDLVEEIVAEIEAYLESQEGGRPDSVQDASDRGSQGASVATPSRVR